MIPISEDDILEGDETFRLRIVAARFMEQAAAIFRAQDELTNTFADVIIEDDDCEFSISLYCIYLKIVCKSVPVRVHIGMYLILCNASFTSC